MWTPAARSQLARGDTPHATGLTNQKWAVVAPIMPKAAKTGRSRRRPMCLVLDDIQGARRTGCAWAHLPHGSRRTKWCCAGSLAKQASPSLCWLGRIRDHDARGDGTGPGAGRARPVCHRGSDGRPGRALGFGGLGHDPAWRMVRQAGSWRHDARAGRVR